MQSSWALVTGASSGIGYEFARIFAAHQVNLILIARKKSALQRLARTLRDTTGVEVIVRKADLSKSEEAVAIPRLLTARHLRLDYVVNNAGFGDFGRFTKTDWSKEAAMIDLNIKALTYLTKYAAIHMAKRRRGYIVNVASAAAFQPGPMMAVYFATKAYVLHFSEAIAEELAGTGVAVTALCPGPTQSNFWTAANKVEGFSFLSKNMPTAEAVAAYGYEAMLRGDRVAIYGLTNRLGALLVRFAPRRLVTWVLMRGLLTL
jgi:hypothetical protein